MSNTDPSDVLTFREIGRKLQLHPHFENNNPVSLEDVMTKEEAEELLPSVRNVLETLLENVNGADSDSENEVRFVLHSLGCFAGCGE